MHRYVFNAFVPLYAYPASEAPNYKYGYKINAAFWGIYLLGIPVIVLFERKFPPKKPVFSDADVEDIRVVDEKNQEQGADEKV